MKIGLVSCTKLKRKGVWPARELYWVSAIFRKSVLYCEHCYDGWYVLSAKHHLVHPDQEIEYYQLKLSDLPVGERRCWGELVSRQLKALGPGVEFYGLAPAMYLDALSGVTIFDIFKGMRQGERQHWLITQLESFGIAQW